MGSHARCLVIAQMEERHATCAHLVSFFCDIGVDDFGTCCSAVAQGELCLHRHGRLSFCAGVEYLTTITGQHDAEYRFWFRHGPTIIPSKSFSNSFAVEGVRTFNGDGTGTVTGSEMGITVPPTPDGATFPHFPPSASSATFSYSFTYTFNNDGSFTNMVTGSITGTFQTGPRSGQTFTVSNFPQLLGMSSQNSSALTLATLVPTVETITYSNGDVWPRICHRSRVLIWMGQ
jgi:hypothetical protein